MSIYNNIDSNNVNGLDPKLSMPVQDDNNHLEISAFYYVMLAAMSNLNSSKNCIDPDDQKQEELAMMQNLANIKSMDAKKTLIDFMRHAMQESGDVLMTGMLDGMESQLQECQDKINDAIKQYQTELDKLEGKDVDKNGKKKKRGFFSKLWRGTKKDLAKAGNYIATINENHKKIDKEKKEKIADIKAILNKPNKTEKDFEQMQTDFKDLFSIIDKERKNGWLAASGSWLDHQGKIAWGDVTSTFGGDSKWMCYLGAPGAALVAGLAYAVGGLFDVLADMDYTDTSSEKSITTTSGKAQAYVQVEQSLFQVLTTLADNNLHNDQTFIDQTANARKAYSDVSKQTDDLAKSISDVS
ncbi:MAG: hypothetical protein WCT85_03030 [Parachlamydiales bacterium]|jgi:hypothetical protein